MGSETLEFKGDAPQALDSYLLYVYRPSELPPDYKNLILAPFLNSLRFGNDLFKLIDKNSYYKNYSVFIERLILKPNVKVRIAALDDKTVLGWCLYENEAIHYIWVKKEVRRQGIGRALLPKDFNKITHVTRVGMNIWANKFPEVKFDPF